MDLKKEPRGKMVLLYRLSTKRFWWLATGSRNALQALGTGPSGDACQKMFAKKNPSMPIFTHCITPPPKSLVRDKKKKVTVAKVASASQLASHAKFLGEAKKYGGNRIIVDKKEAKQVVLDTLSDAFRPMNFNELYKVRIKRSLIEAF